MALSTFVCDRTYYVASADMSRRELVKYDTISIESDTMDENVVILFDEILF